jgi:hypothetical protein
MRSTLTALTLATSFPAFAEAEGRSVFAEVGFSTALHDRGEQLSAETLELLAGLEQSISFGAVYATMYRIQPLDGAASPFTEETDYSVGLVVDDSAYSLDLSANWLTYPGSGDDSSLELVAALDLHVWAKPHIMMFHDVHTDDAGVEVSVGPDWEFAEWKTLIRARLGSVRLGDGSPGRTYAGLEFSAERALSKSSDLGVFVAYDASSRKTLSAETRAGEITGFRSRGIAAGVSVSTRH